MDSEFKQTIKVLASHTDFDAKVGLIESVALFQDNMSDYYGNLKCDGLSLVKSCSAFWALTKTKIKFFNNVTWGDEVNMLTDIFKLSPVRMNLCSKIYSDKIKLQCIQELCAVDFVSRKPRMINTISNWPNDVIIKDNFTELQFEKLSFDDNDSFQFLPIVIKSNDVDFFGHTNNVSYVRYMMGILSSDFWKSIKLKEFEIHYIKESRENSQLDFGYFIGNNEVLFIVKQENEIITKARLLFDK